MKLESTRQLPVSQDRAWRALNDLDVLKHCIPGCESLTQTSDGVLEAVVAMRIGPVGARFSGKVTLEDVAPPESYRLVFTGQGGAAGYAKGEARVRLEPQTPTSTELRYTADASVGGKLAQVGSRLIESSAKKIAEEFFTRFEATLAAPQANPEPNGGEAAGTATSSAAAPSSSRPVPYLWIGAAAVLAVAAIAIYFS